MASRDAKRPALELTAVPGLPLIEPGDDLGAVVAEALEAAALATAAGDVFVIAQKIVSKAERRYAFLDEVTPSARAVALAAEVGKDPRLMELILAESDEVLRRRPGLVIVRHKLGHVTANAGIDHSNIEPVAGRERVLLLPRDPMASSVRLRRALSARFAVDVGVIVSDSVGRPWRLGIVGIALGVAGIPAVHDRRGEPDLFGRTLEVTQVGFADSVASLATLLMGEGAERTPLVRVRGLAWPPADDGLLVRDAEEDLFR